MGSSPYGSGTNCIRWLFVACNFFFFVLGAITFSIGVWGVVEGSDNDYDLITGNETVSGAALLLVSGIITLAIAVVGIIGACAMWRPLLVIYAIAVFIIIVLEIAGAIVAFVFQDNIRDEFRDNMEDAIREYRLNTTDPDHQSDVNNAVESVQDQLECCGVKNASDWLTLNPDAVRNNGGVPPANCKCDANKDDCTTYTGTLDGQTISFLAWEDGCLDILEDNARRIAIASGIVGIIVAVIEILFILMAIGLCCCITSTHRQSVV